MGTAWQRVAIIEPGGTVFAVVQDSKGQPWLATSAGIYCRRAGVWQPPGQGQPLSQLSALTGAGQRLFAGNSLGQIVYTSADGKTWYRAGLSHTGEPITCLAASPSFQHDGVILAGTGGAGVLRSTDGGRHWRLSSHGLQDFTTLALATAPEWGRREIVFAGTTRGLYRSPNGGRAWKKVDSGLETSVVQSLALSPDFGHDGTVFAGTETDGLVSSVDGGKSWQPVVLARDDEPSINAIWLHPEWATTPICLAGSSDGRIFRSPDGGKSWTCVASGHAPILCLGGNQEGLYAGLHDQGLLASSDGGGTWLLESQLAARALTNLVPGAGAELVAWGPWEGAWRSADSGETWCRLGGLPRPILALAASPAEERRCLLAGTDESLLRSTDDGRTWEVVLERQVTALAFSPRFADEPSIWAGLGSGELLASSDGGLTWRDLHLPPPGTPLLKVAVQVGSDGVVTLVAASYEAASHQLTLWRSTDRGDTWQRWWQEKTDWPSVHLDLAGGENEGDVVCLGHACWRFAHGDWQRILDANEPILSLCHAAGREGLMILTSRQLLVSGDGLTWHPDDEGLAHQQLVSLALCPASAAEPTLYALGAGGVVWRRRA